jgi:O-antigen ligase
MPMHLKQIMSLARSLNTGALTSSTKKNSNLILVLICLAAGVAMGGAIAYLLVNDQWQFALGLVFALPVFVLMHRYPFIGLLIWVGLAPFVVSTDGGGATRKIFWVLHRGLPPLTVAIIYLSSWLHIYKRKLPRLGWPELFMLGYIIVTQLSIIYLSDSAQATTIQFYDRVVAPMFLYLLVRLLNPEERHLRWLIPVLIFVLLVQSIVGTLSWTIPGALPSAWQNRVGSRTTGTLSAYSVFSSTVMFCGLFIVHKAFSSNLSIKARQFYILLFGLSVFMVFFSFSRGSWLACAAVLVILAYSYKKEMLRFALMGIPLVMIIFSLSFSSQYTDWAKERFYSEDSEESALSRLPVVYASLQMFASKPVFGWGFGNFDKYDRQFQARVGDLINAEKDHASHNVYLTLLAEQGLIGFTFFLFPVFWCLWSSIKAWPLMPKQGFWSRKLLALLWGGKLEATLRELVELREFLGKIVG